MVEVDTTEPTPEVNLQREFSQEFGEFYTRLVYFLYKTTTTQGLNPDIHINAYLEKVKNDHVKALITHIWDSVKQELSDNSALLRQLDFSAEEVLVGNLVRTYGNDREVAESLLKELSIRPVLEEPYPGLVVVKITEDEATLLQERGGLPFNKLGSAGYFSKKNAEGADVDVEYFFKIENNPIFIDLHEVHHVILRILEKAGVVRDPLEGYKARGESLFEAMEFSGFRQEITAYTLSDHFGWENFRRLTPESLFRYGTQTSPESQRKGLKIHKLMLEYWDIYIKKVEDPQVTDFLFPLISSVSFTDAEEKLAKFVGN